MSEYKLEVTLNARQAAELYAVLSLTNREEVMPYKAYRQLSCWVNNNFEAMNQPVEVHAEIDGEHTAELDCLIFQPREG